MEESPTLTVEQILHIRELQVKSLAIQNRLYALQAEFEETSRKAAAAQKELQELFTQAAAVGGDSYQLNADSLKFLPKT